MSTVLTPSLPLHALLHPSVQDGRSVTRDWLMAGHSPDQLEQGRPAWAWAMAAGFPEAAEELLQAGANPNVRDAEGQGWVHWGVKTHQPRWLILAGLQRLDQHWWHPDRHGMTPFHLLTLDPALAHALGARWWTEQRRWHALCPIIDPVDHAEAHDQALLARIWRLWRARARA